MQEWRRSGKIFTRLTVEVTESVSVKVLVGVVTTVDVV